MQVDGDLNVDGDIFASNTLITSDRRIKKDIVAINDSSALQKVRDLESYYYYYIDSEKRGDLITAGFIAQEVKEIIPEAVIIKSDFIPSEYRYITNPNWEQISENTYKLTIPDLDLSGNELNGNVEFKFRINNEEKILTTIVGEPYSFIVNQYYTQVFIYGKRVNDFHLLDKAKIFTYHHSAIQELDRQQVADKERIATLESQVATQQTTINDMLARITAFEGST